MSVSVERQGDAELTNRHLAVIGGRPATQGKAADPTPFVSASLHTALSLLFLGTVVATCGSETTETWCLLGEPIVCATVFWEEGRSSDRLCVF